MKKLWEQLKPQERRWVIGIGCLLFLTFNYFFIWPRFTEWHKNGLRMEDAHKQIAKYSVELAKTSYYQRQVNDFSSNGMVVPQENQSLSFETAIQNAAGENSVQIQSMSPTSKSTNEFFLEQSRHVQLRTGQSNLVNFLYSLGSGGSLMRVRDLTVRPVDANRYELYADLKIVASYQKNPPAPAPKGAIPAKPAAPATAPAPVAKAPVDKLTGPAAKPMAVTNKPGPAKK